MKQVSGILPRQRLLTSELQRLAWGTDASFYRLIPQAVAIVKSEEEAAKILALASRHNVPVTFRAAGTGLSGQSVSDSLLMVAAHGWEDYKIHDQGMSVTLQPGIRGARVNQFLAPYGRIFTPDPASIATAMVGGIVANNASGMNCGTHANSDKMMRSMRIVLVDGTVIDTAKPSDNPREQQLLRELAEIRTEICADQKLCDRIKYKYSIKNVTGLNLLPFVTYDDPRDILAHVMVGSEGTLGFISEVTMTTGPKLPCSSSTMAYFSDMAQACRAVVELKKDVPEVYSCEMLDKKSLASVHDTTGTGLTALLIETRAGDDVQLHANEQKILAVLDKYQPFQPVHFTGDPAQVAALWKMRSGVFPAVGGTRPIGTTSLIEDIAFHIDDLPQATADLAKLIDDCGYDDACIYGHAFEGNYHFVIAQAFEKDADLEKYKHLIQEIVKLVVDKYDGSLKAEHGTGRNMAPFVEKEWGEKAYGYMRRIKQAFDPQGLLNPGVIFNDAPDCYVHNLKPLPVADQIVDRCIECGFCEPNCVSCGFTLSARERIAVYREISRLRESGEDDARLAELIKQYRYLGDETCAADGLCSTSCPMGINTGELTHKIRSANRPQNSLAYKMGKNAAEKLPRVESGLRVLLKLAHAAHSIVGDSAVNAIGKQLHRAGLPLWTASLPTDHKVTPVARDMVGKNGKVVYFPSCINQTMGAAQSKGQERPEALTDVMVRLIQRAGYEVIFPQDMDSLCCGMIWESKGMPDIADRMTAQLELALREASKDGRYPILCDQSPCLHRMRQHIKSLKLYEPAEFIADILAPHLDFHPIQRSVAVHITCSTRLMGLADRIVELAKKCATDVLVPDEVGCCGFAGDKGFTHPELNAWGLRKLRPQIEQHGSVAGYSNSRTCEIGLTTNSGIPYQSIAYLVDEATAPLPEDPH